MNKEHTRFLQLCKPILFLFAMLFLNGITYASHADLELTMSSPNANPGVFANVDIEITITNNGPELTNSVLLEFPFPSNLPITGDPIESQGFFSNWWTGTGTWDVGTLASGQTETVTLTLFTLSEDLFFYGQVVNSSIVDNDSSPSNGIPPIPSEDDEAVVNINDTGGGVCELLPFVGNIICDDAGTPDPLDDNFSFIITVDEQNAPSNNWATELPLGGGATITHPYGAPYSIALTESVVQNLVGRVYEFTVYDPANPSCSEYVSVLIPQPCSNTQPCSLTALTGNVQCFDNGASENDVWSFDMNVIPQNATGTWMANLNGQTYIGNFNENTQLGLFPVLDGDVTLTVFASVNSSCSTTITVQAPPPCTDQNCNISFMGIDEVCDDNGTPNDPLDDVWFAHINPIGSGLGSTFSIAGSIQESNLAYGQTYIFGPYPIQPFFEIGFTITDDDNGCFSSFILDGTATCSDGGNDCEITATVVSIDCDTQGNTNPNDDTWSYIVDIDGTNTSNTWVVELANSPNNVTYSGPYSSNFTLEDLPLNGLAVNTQTIMDAANPSCQTTISVDAPFPCSNASKPDLELSMTSNNQPGAFQNISYEVTVTNTGTAPANGVNIFGTTPDNVVLQGGNECNATAGNTSCQLSSIGWFFTTIAPGQSETLTVNFFTLDANPITFYMQVGDLNGEDEDSTPSNGTPPTVNEDDEAAFTIGGGQPCQISGPFYNNIQCFDNGTPIEADDFFDFEISVDGAVGGAFNLTTNAGVNGIFNYGQSITITGFPYANLPFSMSATDVNDPICFLSQNNNGSFQPCSTGTDCTIFQQTTRVCDDNGTTDSNDDTYVIEMIATGTGADTGTGWTVDYNGQTYSGLYGQVGIVGPFLINDSNFTLTLQDNENPDCSTNFLSLPPPPCSTGGGGDTDLKLEVTPNTIFAGSSVVVYTATITNEGPNDASGVSMLFDNGSSFGVLDFDLSTGSYSFSTDIWSVGTIAAGTSETIILEDQYVDFNANSLPTFPFFEILTMDGIDPDSTPGNDNGNRTADEDDEATFPIFPNGGGGYPTDLSVNLSAPSTTISLGETVTFTFNVNLDDGAAIMDVAAELELPTSLQYQSHIASQGTFNANTGEWEVGYIGGLSDAELTITATMVTNAPISIIYAQLTEAGNFYLDFDSTPGNGSCCIPNEDDEATLTLTNGTINLPDFTPIDFNINYFPNDNTLSMGATATNLGGDHFGNFSAKVYLSDDPSFSIDDVLVFTYSPVDFLGGETEFFSGGPQMLPSSITSGNYFALFILDDANQVIESDESNNIAVTSLTIGPAAPANDLELGIFSSSTFNQWGNVSFDIVLTNAGTTPRSNIAIEVAPLEGGVYQGGNESSTTAGSFNAQNGSPIIWDLTGLTLVPGQSETLTINGFVLSPDFFRVYAQIISHSGTDPDSTPNNGTPPITNEDDEVAKTLGNAPSPLLVINGNSNTSQSFDYQYFKIKNLYPNPVSAHLKMTVASALEGDAVLQIANTQGSEVAYFKKQLTQGQNVLDVDVSTLPKGIYFLKIETEEGMEVRRFLKQ